MKNVVSYEEYKRNRRKNKFKKRIAKWYHPYRIVYELTFFAIIGIILVVLIPQLVFLYFGK